MENFTIEETQSRAERLVKDYIRRIAENYTYPSIKTTLKGFLMNTTILTKNGVFNT